MNENLSLAKPGDVLLVEGKRMTFSALNDDKAVLIGPPLHELLTEEHEVGMPLVDLRQQIAHGQIINLSIPEIGQRGTLTDAMGAPVAVRVQDHDLEKGYVRFHPLTGADGTILCSIDKLRKDFRKNSDTAPAEPNGNLKE